MSELEKLKKRFAGLTKCKHELMRILLKEYDLSKSEIEKEAILEYQNEILATIKG